VVLLSAGSSILADYPLLAAQDLFVDEAALTGESFPVEKSPGIVPADAPLARRHNALFLGTHVISGSVNLASGARRMVRRVRGLRNVDRAGGAHAREFPAQLARARAVGRNAGGDGRDADDPVHIARCGLWFRPIATALFGTNGVDRAGVRSECRVGETLVLQGCAQLIGLLYSFGQYAATPSIEGRHSIVV